MKCEYGCRFCKEKFFNKVLAIRHFVKEHFHEVFEPRIVDLFKGEPRKELNVFRMR